MSIKSEQGQVGIVLASTDGINFSVSATYAYLDKTGQVLGSGIAEVDDKKVFK